MLSAARERSLVGHEHDFAGHASCAKQFVRLSCLAKWKSVGDERRDLMPLKQMEQGNQILSKHRRPQSFQPLNAVGDHPFSAREQPSSGNVEREDGDRPKTVTTT